MSTARIRPRKPCNNCGQSKPAGRARSLCDACQGTVSTTRLLSKAVYDPSGCLVWTGARNNKGYGRISVGAPDRKFMPVVHRVSYELFIGPIPDGLVLDHLCRNRLCLNPLHLEPVTGAENTRRGVQATKTHCKNGHEFTEANTNRSSGTRACRTCATNRSNNRPSRVAARGYVLDAGEHRR